MMGRNGTDLQEKGRRRIQGIALFGAALPACGRTPESFQSLWIPLRMVFLPWLSSWIILLLSLRSWVFWIWAHSRCSQTRPRIKLPPNSWLGLVFLRQAVRSRKRGFSSLGKARDMKRFTSFQIKVALVAEKSGRKSLKKTDMGMTSVMSHLLC